MADDPAPDDGPAGGSGGDQPADAEPGEGTPEGQEQPADRGDQFADAASDPLADAVGGSASRSMGQAYRSWAHLAGPGAFITGSRFRDVNLGTAIYAYDRHAPAPGPVRPEIIENLVLRYVPVSCYGSLISRLKQTSLLALRGAPGTGRATTGLRLLADVAEQVCRFGPDTNVNQLADDDLEDGYGYLIDLIPGWAKPAAAATNADRLQHQLAERGCFMIVVLPHDIQYRAAFEDYVADCPTPDPGQLLTEAIEHELRQRPDAAKTLHEIRDAAPLDGFAGARLPRGARHAAALMAACAAGAITREEMTGRAGEALAQHAAGWFEPLAQLPASAAADEQVRLATFRIALAVFHQMPFDVVAEAGERLAAKIMTAGSPRRQPGRSVFANHRDDYLADSLGELVTGSIEFGKSGVQAAFAQYADEWMPAAVLRHVWDVHNIRGQLLPWLQELSGDSRPFVWMRAALSLGQLCSWDFAYTFHEFIDPWASRPVSDARQHLVAAVALDAASRNPDVLPVVREILEGWCRKGSRDQRWTAATALGYDLGLHDAQASLNNLQAVASWDDGALALIASWAVERIFARGAIEPVMTAIGRWLDDDRVDVRFLALRSALRIANLKVADLDDPGTASGTGSGRRPWRHLAGRDDWPLLAALAEEDSTLLDLFADIIWPVTRSAAFPDLSLKALEGWIRAGQKDRTCVGAVARLLRLLGDDDADQARLAHLITELRRDREDPLPADIAGTLLSAIEPHDCERAGAPE